MGGEIRDQGPLVQKKAVSDGIREHGAQEDHEADGGASCRWQKGGAWGERFDLDRGRQGWFGIG